MTFSNNQTDNQTEVQKTNNEKTCQNCKTHRNRPSRCLFHDKFTRRKDGSDCPDFKVK